MNPLATLAAIGLFNVDPRSIESGLLWIPLIPMLAALFNGLFGSRMSKTNVAWIACGAVGVSFGLAVLGFFAVYPDGHTVLYQDVYTWFSAGNLHVEMAFAVDRFSSVLLLVITGVGLLIHLYSIGYMSDDPGFWRFFAYLNFFVGMMLILVMGANLIVMFVGWEGVGLASYLLIGFWYDDDQKAYAGRKAFVVNRIGDFGFLLGIFTLIATLGTVNFYAAPQPRLDTATGQVDMVTPQPIMEAIEHVKSQLEVGQTAPAGLDHLEVRSGPFRGQSYTFVFTLAALLLFLGACGKSAQLPLFVWLPDAMAGPTPVSALIHAATMVTAGVYMTCRLNYLFGEAPDAMLVVAFVGACTALFAAIIGTAQNDLKKVLAYSTVSQLGYMILGVGVGAFWAASLHLLTHAFFKACLFLGAGSVMHGMAGETNIWKMGGLRKDMKVTAITFLIATITITGVLPLSGFFSKDAILDLAHHSHFPHSEIAGYVLYALGTLGALGTAFYMFRAYFLTFEGERRTLKDHHAHESGIMNFPLIVLAGLSIAALGLGLPFFGEGGHETLWQLYLDPVFAPGQLAVAHWVPGHEAEAAPWMGWIIAIVIAWAGAGYAYFRYVMNGPAGYTATVDQPSLNPVLALVQHKFYVDELYDALVVRPYRWTAFHTWEWIDKGLIDGVCVRGWGFVSMALASVLRRFQNGSAQRYAALMAISLVALLFSSPVHHALAQLFPSWFGQ